MKIAICLSGHMRTYKLCYQSLKDEFINHEVDYYIHTWDNIGFGAVNSPIDTDHKIDLLDVKNIYKPKKFVVEKYPYEVDISKYLNPNILQVDHEKIRIYSMIKKINLCLKLVEQINKYDLVVRIRPDIIFRKINLSDIVLDKINIQYQHWGDFWNEKFPYMINDYFAIGTPDLMIHYSNLFDYIEEYTKTLPFHPEVLFGYHNKDKTHFMDVKLEIVRR